MPVHFTVESLWSLAGTDITTLSAFSAYELIQSVPWDHFSIFRFICPTIVTVLRLQRERSCCSHALKCLWGLISAYIFWVMSESKKHPVGAATSNQEQLGCGSGGWTDILLVSLGSPKGGLHNYKRRLKKHTFIPFPYKIPQKIKGQQIIGLLCK